MEMCRWLFVGIFGFIIWISVCLFLYALLKCVGVKSLFNIINWDLNSELDWRWVNGCKFMLELVLFNIFYGFWVDDSMKGSEFIVGKIDSCLINENKSEIFFYFWTNNYILYIVIPN